MKQKIVILGAGESGVGAAILAQQEGHAVFVSDSGVIASNYKLTLKKKGIMFEEEGHSESVVLDADEIIKSPGIPDNNPLIVKARATGIPVISEIEFAGRYTDAKFVCITGSNGKTTTTLLAYHLIESSGFNVGLAGNVGESLAKQVARDKDMDYYVVELSSFQLDGMYDFKADIAVLLNITPDHMDRYDYDFQKYIDSKFRITQNQTNNDYLITFVDDPVVKRELLHRRTDAFKLSVSLQDRILNGSYLSNEKLVFNIHNHMTHVFSTDTALLPITGKHNYINTMAATMAALAAGVTEKQILRALTSFQNAPHRLEDAGMVNRVRYINDSKATNVDSVKYALDSFDQPIVWIAGGVDKGNEYEVLEELVSEKVRALICLGKDNEKLIKAFGGIVPMIIETQSVDEAVRYANEIANAEDIVLLSPACASFDLFKNYEDRGNKFKDAVKGMEKSSPLFNMITLF